MGSSHVLIRAAVTALLNKHVARNSSHLLCELLLRYAQSTLAARRWLGGRVVGCLKVVWQHASRVLARAQEGEAAQQDVTVCCCVVVLLLCDCCVVLLLCGWCAHITTYSCFQPLGSPPLLLHSTTADNH